VRLGGTGYFVLAASGRENDNTVALSPWPSQTTTATDGCNNSGNPHLSIQKRFCDGERVTKTVYLGPLMFRIDGDRAEVYEQKNNQNRLICVTSFREVWSVLASLVVRKAEHGSL